MKRSISTGNISVNTTPVLVLKKGVQDDNGGEELPIVEALRKKNAELEMQLSNALETSWILQGRVETYENGGEGEIVLKTRIEQLEAELEVTKVELRIRQEDVDEENDKLAKQLDSLKVN